MKIKYKNDLISIIKSKKGGYIVRVKNQYGNIWRRITRANTLDNAINKGKVFIDIFKK